MVCPQVIGQASKNKFCDYFSIGDIGVEEIKGYIVSNISMILSSYWSTTFDSNIVYYNKHFNRLMLINILPEKKIIWDDYIISFSHLIKNKFWLESTTISIGDVTIGSFQIHNNRNCIKFRWKFENVIKFLASNFQIYYL